MVEKKKLQIVDIDDTIVFTSAKWILEAVKHPGLMKRMKNLSVPLESIVDMNMYMTDVYCRPVYDLTKFLEVSDIAKGLFYKAYTENGQFYDDLNPTLFGGSLISGGVGNKIIFLTHILDGVCNVSKEKWIKNNFGKLDYEYVELSIGQSKGEFIQENYPDFDTFVDDNPDCLTDVIERFKNEPKYIAYPQYGYNVVMEEYAKILEEQNAKVNIRGFLQR
jgi:hypothetical protein